MKKASFQKIKNITYFRVGEKRKEENIGIIMNNSNWDCDKIDISIKKKGFNNNEKVNKNDHWPKLFETFTSTGMEKAYSK